jgi:hypothetical protein
MYHSVLFVTLVLSAQDLPPQDSRPSVRELLKVYGVSEQIVVTDDAQLEPAALLAGSDLVVRGVMRGRNDKLTKDGLSVLTDYTFEVREAIHPRDGFPKERYIVTVQRPEGTVNVSGRAFVASENGFPRFTLNEEYFLFLRWDGANAYRVVGGAQGAYRVSNGYVYLSDGRGPNIEVAADDFAHTLRAELDRQASRN